MTPSGLKPQRGDPVAPLVSASLTVEVGDAILGGIVSSGNSLAFVFCGRAQG
jgi:hypothetical protein